MTAGTCSATVTVVGIGAFTCGLPDCCGHECHRATLPSEKWAFVSWTGDNATIAPPGSRRVAS